VQRDWKLRLQNAHPFGLVVTVAPGEDFVGGDGDESPFVAVIVAEIPFILMIKVISQNVYGLAVGNVGFAFDDDGAGGIGQGEGDILVVVHVGEFLGRSAGGKVDEAIEPDKPEGNQVGTAVLFHRRQPDSQFPAEPGFNGTPPRRICSFHLPLALPVDTICQFVPRNGRFSHSVSGL
jgi:hypothetical protein